MSRGRKPGLKGGEIVSISIFADGWRAGSITEDIHHPGYFQRVVGKPQRLYTDIRDIHVVDVSLIHFRLIDPSADIFETADNSDGERIVDERNVHDALNLLTGRAILREICRCVEPPFGLLQIGGISNEP